MRYEKPQVTTVSVVDLLGRLGPARAWDYQDEGSDCYFWQYMSGKCR